LKNNRNCFSVWKDFNSSDNKKNEREEKMKALFVIDMLKDFIESNGALYCGESSRKIIPFVKKKIEEFHERGDLVVFICDWHHENDSEFKMFPKHSIAGTEGAKIIDELPVKEKDLVLKKTRFSSFYNTGLDNVLNKYDINEVHVVGVCTSICVMDTVGDLRNRDYKTVVYLEGVADFDRNAHLFSIERMKKIYGARIK
jgi:nicotinamidase-related amidase